MKRKMWKVSLLVTTYNSKDNLAVTLENIEAQNYPDIEVLIVDGQSTDGTVDMIQEFAKKHMGEKPIESPDDSPFLSVRWVSEPDSGLYDAMNKAWAMCTGDIVAVCNDKFCTSDAVTKLVRAIEQGGENCIGAHADLVYVDGERVVRTWHMGEGKLSQGWMPGHPTLFLKREVYEQYGTYNIAFHPVADYEFMVRFLKDEGNHLAYVPEVLIAMFYGGTSSAGFRSYWLSFREGYRALKENSVPHPLLITMKRTIRVLRQFF